MERMGHALLVGAGDDVSYVVVASEGLDELPESVTHVRVALPRRPAFLRIMWFALRSGREVRRWRERVDLVHSCGAITREPVDLATVHLCQAAVPAESRSSARGWRRGNALVARVAGRHLERRQYRAGRVRELVAVSDQVAGELALFYPGVARTTIDNGVDLTRFERPERTGPPSTVLRVVMVTGDFALKGVDLAVAAVAAVPGVVLTVVGRGDPSWYLREATAAGARERVRFSGPLADPRDVYDDSDVVLAVARYEAFGLYLVEAALAGCAVLACDVGVAAVLVGDGDGGLLVERSVQGVAGGLTELATNPAATRARGAVAQARARQFSQTRMVERYHDLYRSLAPADAP